MNLEKHCFPMETIKWLQGVLVFVKISELGSFSLAAKKLGVSKSHVSKTIQQLEKELGTSLFSRSTKSIELTHLGEHFLQNCRASLETLEEAKKDVIGHSETPRGKLRVSLAGIFGENFIAPVAINLAKKYPELDIELNFDNRIVDLIKEKFDVAIRFGHLPSSSLIAQKIASRREYICASPAYLKRHDTPKKPEDLVDHNCMSESGVWSFRKKGVKLSVDVRGNFFSNNPRVLLKAATDGLGIARLPGSYVHPEFKTGQLVPILETYSDMQTDIWAVTPTKKKMNVNVDVFLKELKLALLKDYADILF